MHYIRSIEDIRGMILGEINLKLHNEKGGY